MDEWLKQLQADIHEAAKDSSDWFADVSQESNKAIESWVTSSLDAFEMLEKGIEETVSPALEDFDTRLDEAVDASVLFIDQKLTPWIEEATAPVTHTVTPWLQNHSACIGCKYYHGTAYGEEMLVCGMHPYGPDDRDCADWESVWSASTLEDQ